MHGEDVRLLDPARIDALVRLDRRERGEAVAQHRRALEVERRRRLVHLGREFLACTARLLPDRNAFASRTSSA